jgi:ABC-2 type transport system permease protein
MSAVLRIALHDLRRVLSDRSAALWLAVMPIVFATFFGLVIGGGNPSQAQARLTVVDEDGGVVARELVDALASKKLEVVEMTAAERAAAQNAIRTLVIPEGFSAKVLAGEQVTLRLEKDPGSDDRAALVAQARIVSAIARVTGRLVEAAQGLAAGESIAPDALAALPPAEDLVQVEASFAGRSRTAPGGFTQSIPGMTVMFVMLVALTYGAASLSAERAGGQLRRLMTAPVLSREIVTGKIVGRYAIAAVQIMFLVAVGVIAHHAFGVPIGDSPGAALIVLLVYALAVTPLGVLAGAAIRDPDRAASVGVVATMAMAGLGGCWWPIEIVSPTLQKVALVFPSGWAMLALHRVIAFGQPLSAVTVPLAVLVGFAIALGVLAVRQLRLE